MAKKLKFDRERIMNGTIPWTAEGLRDAFDFVSRLLQTPKDDWPLERVQRESATIVDEDTGELMEIRFNAFAEWNQTAACISQKYPQTGSDYNWRFDAAVGFIRRNVARLRDAGLLETKDEMLRLTDGLMEALAVLPYTDRSEEAPCFDYDEVVARAKNAGAGES